mgnify:CR=1 FL=1
MIRRRGALAEEALAQSCNEPVEMFADGGTLDNVSAQN